MYFLKEEFRKESDLKKKEDYWLKIYNLNTDLIIKPTNYIPKGENEDDDNKEP